jgi:cation diffusion facilitator family transporter
MSDIKETAAFNSILASAGLAAAKLVAAVVSGSLAMMSDALHALLDVGATILTYAAVKIGARPADERHPYGHGKVEAVAALIETGLLMVVAVYAGVEAISRIWKGAHEVPPSYIAFGVLAVSIVVDVVRSRSLMRIARETKSEALAADALHFSSDLVSSALVLAGLIAAGLGYPQGDLLAALGVAVFIAIAGFRLGKRTIDTLMDAVPKELTAKVKQVASDVAGVAKVENVRVRAVGQEIFAEVAIGVARTLPLDRVTGIKDRVVAALMKEYPVASVVVTTSPVALDDETVLERVLHVAAVMRRPVHHVTIQRIGERLAVSLDLEVDGQMRLSEGHAVATQLESGIALELGNGVEVEAHLEPLEVHALDGAEVTEAEASDVRDTLRALVDGNQVIGEIHDVRVRRTPVGLVCNYHCYVDPDRTIRDVHEHVDAFDREVRNRLPDIIRVVSHAEPRPARGNVAVSVSLDQSPR